MEMCEDCLVDPPWDWPCSPEACYCGCGGASGSWEGFVRRTPDGAYGTHPAVEVSTVHYQTEFCIFKEKKEINF